MSFAREPRIFANSVFALGRKVSLADCASLSRNFDWSVSVKDLAHLEMRRRASALQSAFSRVGAQLVCL
jgi:hypothetical protein